MYQINEDFVTSSVEFPSNALWDLTAVTFLRIS